MTPSKMNPTERQAVLSLSIIMALRMLGLFMVLPLLALYAAHLPDATPFLTGVVVGGYGLTQAIFQIPLGALSDHFGRKKIIALGLVIFIVGSLIAAFSPNVWSMLFGRALQGAGAVGSTIMALIADLTRPEQRTKAMALAGITIGASFSFAMVLGPLLAAWLQVSGIFGIAALCGGSAILLLFIWVPTPIASTEHAEIEPHVSQFPALLKHPELNRLNIGIFILHLIFTASFVVIPISMQMQGGITSNQQWILYLPTLLGAFVIALICIWFAEKKHRLRRFFLGGIGLLGIAECLLWIFAQQLLLFAVSLLLFFIAFTLLEAFLPSLVSRTAPPHRKGTALGIYSCSQFLGIFAGGTLGGWLYGAFGPLGVYLFCAILASIWSAIAFNMKNPHYSSHS